MDEFTSPVSEQPTVEPTTVERGQVLAYIDRELIDPVRHLSSDPSQVINAALRQWLWGDPRLEDDSVAASEYEVETRRIEHPSRKSLIHKVLQHRPVDRNQLPPPLSPRTIRTSGEKNVTDIRLVSSSTEILERLTLLELSVEKIQGVISSLNIEEGSPPVQESPSSRPNPEKNYLRIKVDRAIAFSSGGAFLGGIVAQIPGAIIGSFLGFIFAAAYSPRKVKVHRD